MEFTFKAITFERNKIQQLNKTTENSLKSVWWQIYRHTCVPSTPLVPQEGLKLQPSVPGSQIEVYGWCLSHPVLRYKRHTLNPHSMYNQISLDDQGSCHVFICLKWRLQWNCFNKCFTLIKYQYVHGHLPHLLLCKLKLRLDVLDSNPRVRTLVESNQ